MNLGCYGVSVFQKQLLVLSNKIPYSVQNDDLGRDHKFMMLLKMHVYRDTNSTCLLIIMSEI